MIETKYDLQIPAAATMGNDLTLTMVKGAFSSVGVGVQEEIHLETPDSFKRGMDDILMGRVVDVDVAHTRCPPSRS